MDPMNTYPKKESESAENNTDQRYITDSDTPYNPTFHITTLGCKVNQYESDRIAGRLCMMGFRHVGEDEPADICIINTCAVTSEASRKSRQAIRRQRRISPGAVVFAVGCAVEIKETELSNLPDDIRFVGNGEKENLPEMITSCPPLRPPSKRGEIDTFTLHKYSSTIATGHTRAFLKVQDGCDSFCSYCIIPYLRGRSRSREPGDILDELKEIEKAGYKEVVLTGIHLGDYGKGIDGNMDLGDLVNLIAKNSSIPRIRLSSLEPMDFSFKLLNVMKENPRICPHLHLPLQHASDRILKIMNRKYSLEEYDDIIKRAVEFFPEIAITTDVMVGFPGETDRDFEIMYEYIRGASFSRLHCFPYSPRKGTSASRMGGIVAPDVKKERLRQIVSLGRKKSYDFIDKFIGRDLSVLVENKLKSEYIPKKILPEKSANPEFFYGLTPNYISAIFECPENPTGNIVCIKAKERTGDKIYGEKTESLCDS